MNLLARLEKLEAAVAELAAKQAGKGKTIYVVAYKDQDGTIKPKSGVEPQVGPHDRVVQFVIEVVPTTRPASPKMEEPAEVSENA